MAKGDLDLKNKKTGEPYPKIDQDPILGRIDLLLLVLERIAVAAEDLVDILEGQEDDGGDGANPEDGAGAPG